MNIKEAILILGKKFVSVNRRNDTEAQRQNLRQIATIGRSARLIPHAAGGRIAGDLHWNDAQPELKQAHIELWDSHQGKLIENEWQGVMCHVKDPYGAMVCDWAIEGHTSTLNRAVNHVPDWLDNTIEGELLNPVQLADLIATIVV